MLIAVPGCPLPTFWTASIASTRTVSIARRSSSPNPSGSVGFGWGGRPVGESLAASAGASDPVLRVSMCSSLLEVGVIALRPTRSTGGSTSRTLVIPAGAPPVRGLQLPGLSSPSETVPLADQVRGPAPSRGNPVTALSERGLAPSRARSAVALRVGGFVALTKPKLVELLLVTTLPAMMMAADGWPAWRLVGATMVGGMFAAGAANVFNCWYDRDIDRLMSRTRNRPIPSGVVSPRAALVFGGVLAAASL